MKCSFEEEVKYHPYLRIRSSKSPPTSTERTSIDVSFLNSSRSTLSSPLNEGDLRGASSAKQTAPIQPPIAPEELPKQVESLMTRFVSDQSIISQNRTDSVARIAQLEKSLASAQRAPADYIDTPRSRTAASFNVPFETSPSHQSYHSPPIIPSVLMFR